MKTKFLAFVMLLAFSGAAVAQQAQVKEKRTPEQRLEKRVLKMQKELMLDEAAAAKFAPVYKEYLLEMSKCRPAVERGGNLTDAQIKKNIEARMDARQKALDVEKKYYGKLSKILNAKQLQKVFGEKKDFPGKKGDARKGKHAGKERGHGKAKKGADCKQKDCRK